MHATPDPLTPPDLADLFARYLQQQTAAREQGWSSPEPSGEVVPHEATPVQVIEPRLAWEGALTAAEYFGDPIQQPSRSLPPDWAGLVASQEPVLAVPFCLGNFPQLVRNLLPLLHPESLTLSRRVAARPALPALVEWAEESMSGPDYGRRLLAAGVLRLARQYDAAGELLDRLHASVPAQWRAALANEEAALAWHRGRFEEAASAWQGQADNVAVLFNRGLAFLFLGQLGKARTSLRRAADALPEQSGWHHLAHLYLAVATAAE